MTGLRRAAIALGILGASGCTGLFFQPNNDLYGHPDAAGVEYETPRFPSTDGTPLTGLWMKSRVSPACGTVVHFHGNLGNFTAHFRYSRWLTDYGFNVLVFDYRGYGNSGGRPSPEGLVEDGLAALRYVRGREDVDPRRVVVLGQSLGGAVAAAALSRDEPGGVQAVALEAPFSSYRSVARAKLGGTWFARLFLRPFAWLLVSDAASPLKAMARRPPVPLVVLHGDADPVVPYEEGARLYRAAPEPKELWTMEGAKHVEAFTRFGGVYRPRLAAFYRKALEKGGGGPCPDDPVAPPPTPPARRLDGP